MLDINSNRSYRIRTVRFDAAEVSRSFEILMLGRVSRYNEDSLIYPSSLRSAFQLMYGELYAFVARSKDDIVLNDQNISELYEHRASLNSEIVSPPSSRLYHIYTNVLIDMFSYIGGVNPGRSRLHLLEDTTLLILAENGIMYRLIHDAIRDPDMHASFGQKLMRDTLTTVEEMIREAGEKLREEVLRSSLCALQDILANLLDEIALLIGDIAGVRSRNAPSILRSNYERIARRHSIRPREDGPSPGILRDQLVCLDQREQITSPRVDLGGCEYLVVEPSMRGDDCPTLAELPCLFEDVTAQPTTPLSTADRSCHLELHLAVR